MTKIYIIVLFLFILSSCEKSQDKNVNLLKFYGDALEDVGYSVAKVENGYVITGQLTEVSRLANNYIDEKSSVKKMGVIKTDINGNLINKLSFGGKQTAVGSKVLALDDGSTISLGYVIDTVTQLKAIYVVKVDATGTQAVEKIYKTEGNQYGTDIIRTPEGFLILGITDVAREPVTESTGNTAGKNDIQLLRINSDLEPIGSPIVVGFPGNDEGAAIKQDISGGYIVVGTTDRSDQSSDKQGGSNILILRINSDGSTTEPRIIGGTDNEYAADIEVLNDGYLIAGTLGSEGPDQRGYVWRLSSDIYAAPLYEDKLEMETASTTAGPFSIKAICRYKTSSIVMAGQYGTGTSAKMLIFLTDTDGNRIEGNEVITGGTGLQVAYDVITDNDDNIIAVGKNSYENNSMISLFKFRF
jgi:hypothetical protein